MARKMTRRRSFRSYVTARRASSRNQVSIATGLNIANIATTVGFGVAPGVGYNVVGDTMTAIKSGTNPDAWSKVGHGIRTNLTLGAPRIIGGLAAQVIARKFLGQVPIGKVGKWRVNAL